MKKTPFKRKSGFKRKTSFKKRGKLRVAGVSETHDLREEAQALLREIAIKRDKRCVMSRFYQTGQCGGFTKGGKLILQYDHLNSRVHAVSFTDSRLGILVCLRHHLYFKRQYPVIYEECAMQAIGKERAELLKRMREDRTAHKVDLKLEILALKKELQKYQQIEK